MNSFPLLSLQPDLAERIVKKFEMQSLFNLAHCSQRMRKMVKIVTLLTCERNENMIFVDLNSTSELELHCGFESEVEMKWKFYGERNRERLGLVNPRPYSIAGQRIDLCADNSNTNYGCRSPVSTALLLEFVDNVADFTNASLCSITLFPTPETVKALGEFNGQRIALRKFDDVIVENTRVSHADMRIILSLSDGVDQLELMCNAGADFEHDKAISAVSLLRVEHSAWMKRTNLDFLRCSVVSLQNSRLDNSDINFYLHQWLNSSDDGIWHIYICGEGPKFGEDYVAKELYDLSRIVEGLPIIPQVSKESLKPCYCQRPELLYGDKVLDFKRPSDGKLASVLIFEDTNNVQAFMFTVWKNKDDNSW